MTNLRRLIGGRHVQRENLFPQQPLVRLPPRFAVPAFPDMIELPPEVWYEILHYVPGHDILHLRLVSKYLDCMITQRILHHARQSKLRISLLDSFSFPKGVEIVSHPTYTSSSTKILLDESKVEYS